MVDFEVMQSPLLLQAIRVTARDANLALPSWELAERISEQSSLNAGPLHEQNHLAFGVCFLSMKPKASASSTGTLSLC